jgi:NADP-dependent 3-hydroxy acid dehydrogenase YdfG
MGKQPFKSRSPLSERRTPRWGPGAPDVTTESYLTETHTVEGGDVSLPRARRPAHVRGIPTGDGFARAVSFAISEPADVDINDIVFRPTKQEL